MIELRGDARFVDEHLDERLVAGEVGQDLLDRDQLLEPELADQLRLEQLGHAAYRDAIENLILPDLLGCGSGHESLIIHSLPVAAAAGRAWRCQFGSFRGGTLVGVARSDVTSRSRRSRIRVIARWHGG
jgi:hypothetical protein